VDWAGMKAPRLLWRKVSKFIIARGIPADTSGADRTDPQANYRIFSVFSEVKS